MEFISGALAALYVIKRPLSSCLSFKAEAASTSGLEAPSPPAPPFLMGQIKQPLNPSSVGYIGLSPRPPPPPFDHRHRPMMIAQDSLAAAEE